MLAQQPVVFPPEDLHQARPFGAKLSSSAKQAPNQFFDGNRKVCADWFQRMRPLLCQTLELYGSSSACYAVCQARLSEALSHLSEHPLPLSQLALTAARGPALCYEAQLEAPPKAQKLTILTDPSARPSHKAPCCFLTFKIGAREAFEALEQSLLPLLRSALKLHDVGLCRGALTLLSHGAWAFQAPKPQGTEALELYAAMRWPAYDYY